MAPVTRATSWPSQVLDFVIEHKGKIIAHLGHVIAALVSIIFFFYPDASVPTFNDYAEFYFGSRLLFSPDFPRLYETSGNWFWFSATFHAPPFRTLPSALLFYVPLGLIPTLASSYTTYVVASVALNVLTAFMCVEIARILKGATIERWTRDAMLFVYFLMPMHFSNYYQGQVGSVIGFLLVTSMLMYLKNREGLASLSIGIALAIKPTSYFIIILLLVFAGSLRKFLTRGVLMCLPACINIIVFMMAPSMLGGFIDVAFMRDYNQGVPLPSVTITSAILMILRILGITSMQTLIFAIVAVPSTIVAYAIARRRPDCNKIATAFVLGTMLYFLCQFDVWPSQTVFLFPFLAIFQMAYAVKPGGNFKLLWLAVATYSVYDIVRVVQVLILAGNLASSCIFYGIAIASAGFTASFLVSALKDFTAGRVRGPEGSMEFEDIKAKKKKDRLP